MRDAPETRLSLVLRLQQADDVQAWNEFTEVYQPVIYRLARSQGLQDADAIDLTQEVLTRVATAVQQFDPDPRWGSFRGWLGRITRNMVIQFLRNRNRRPRTCDDSAMYELLQQAPDQESLEAQSFDLERERELFGWAAAQIRPKFDQRTWQAFWQTAVAGRSAADVAGELQMSRGAVYVARSRIMARLRETVQRFETNHDSYIGLPSTSDVETTPSDSAHESR